MTSITSTGERPVQPLPARPAEAWRRRFASWIPSWSLIATKHLEIRKRRGLMATVAVLIVGVPVLILGVFELLHLANPRIGPPLGGPRPFTALSSLTAEFGFIAAAALGTAAATTDLSEGVFRHLVATGRSRLALYLARIPAGLAIVLPLVAVAFTLLCLVTIYGGAPQPSSVLNIRRRDPRPPQPAAACHLALRAPRRGEPCLRPGVPRARGESKLAATLRPVRSGGGSRPLIPRPPTW